MAVVFGFMYNAENHVNKVSKNPDVKITVQGFQWGWRFIYPNGHPEVGTVCQRARHQLRQRTSRCSYMPAGETVQFHLVSRSTWSTPSTSRSSCSSGT